MATDIKPIYETLLSNVVQNVVLHVAAAKADFKWLHLTMALQTIQLDELRCVMLGPPQFFKMPVLDLMIRMCVTWLVLF